MVSFSTTRICPRRRILASLWKMDPFHSFPHLQIVMDPFHENYGDEPNMVTMIKLVVHVASKKGDEEEIV